MTHEWQGGEYIRWCVYGISPTLSMLFKGEVERGTDAKWRGALLPCFGVYSRRVETGIHDTPGEAMEAVDTLARRTIPLDVDVPGRFVGEIRTDEPEADGPPRADPT